MVQAKMAEWEEKGLFLFFFTACCSEMNDIELYWQHLKRDELSGQMFETESELACHVIWGLENRGTRRTFCGFCQPSVHLHSLLHS